MKPFVFVAIILSTINIAAQTNTWYVSAKAGLSMREKPDQSSLVLDKIPYAAKISLSEDAGTVRIKTENLNGVWRNVNYNGKSGYVVDSYLFEVPPPKAGTKTLREYLQQISTAFGDKLVVKTETAGSEEGGSQLTKQLFSNGAEWHELQGYEYNH